MSMISYLDYIPQNEIEHACYNKLLTVIAVKNKHLPAEYLKSISLNRNKPYCDILFGKLTMVDRDIFIENWHTDADDNEVLKLSFFWAMNLYPYVDISDYDERMYALIHLTLINTNPCDIWIDDEDIIINEDTIIFLREIKAILSSKPLSHYGKYTEELLDFIGQYFEVSKMEAMKLLKWVIDGEGFIILSDKTLPDIIPEYKSQIRKLSEENYFLVLDDSRELNGFYELYRMNMLERIMKKKEGI